MNKVKGLISSLLLISPIAVLAACYGPAPYDCSEDKDCTWEEGGVCSKAAGEKEGYCRYPYIDASSDASTEK